MRPWPRISAQPSEEDKDRPGPDRGMPGNPCGWFSRGQWVIGSGNPPRHWIKKAKVARDSRRIVKNSKRRKCDDVEDKEDDEEAGLSVVWRPAIEIQRKNHAKPKKKEFYWLIFIFCNSYLMPCIYLYSHKLSEVWKRELMCCVCDRRREEI